MFCFLLVAAASQAASGPDESGEASVEVPEAATVDVEEIHPLPEVSTNYTVIAENIKKIYIYIFFILFSTLRSNLIFSHCFVSALPFSAYVEK